MGIVLHWFLPANGDSRTDLRAGQRERYDLSRHWRNARTHASHDPADWKYHTSATTC